MVLPQKAIIHCTGYGAKALFNYASLTPVRRQIGWLIPQPEVNYGLYYRQVNVLARRDGIVVQASEHDEATGWNDDNETPAAPPRWPPFAPLPHFTAAWVPAKAGQSVAWVPTSHKRRFPLTSLLRNVKFNGTQIHPRPPQRSFMHRLPSSLLALLLFGSGPLIRADTFTLVAADFRTGLILTLDLTAVPDHNITNAYDVLTISGRESGSASSNIVTAIASPTLDSTPYIYLSTAGTSFTYNNLIYTSGPVVDVFGLLYTIDFRGTGVIETRNLAYSATYNFNRDRGRPQEQFSSIILTNTTLPSADPAITPEPSTFLLLGTGIASTLPLLRRRTNP